MKKLRQNSAVLLGFLILSFSKCQVLGRTNCKKILRMSQFDLAFFRMVHLLAFFEQFCTPNSFKVYVTFEPIF